MILTKLELIHFRNYKKCIVYLSENINILVGKNGQGKTNILEAIYVLAVTKSHRYGDPVHLILKGQNLAKIKGTLKVGKIYKDLEVDIGKNTKKTLLNSSVVKRISDYITNLNVILFTPDDLEIIKGAPQVRRNFLNVEISQLDKQYIQYLNEYNKILKIRNEYLKSMYINRLSDQRYLDILTDKLIDRAVLIYKYRYQFIEDINENIAFIYEKITSLENLKIVYDNSLDCKTFDEFRIRDVLNSRFNRLRDREIQLGNTLLGPHRDDFSFYLGDDNVKIFSSQGNQRIAVIALKFSEISIFKNRTLENPILLLDDIFSEIDSIKRKRLLEFIDGSVQTIITTTDLKNLSKKIVGKSKIIEVFSGNIVDKE